MKRILALILVLVVLAGCGPRYDTLEKYLQNDDEFMEEIENGDENMKVECKDNTLTLKYDMGKMNDTDVTNYTTLFESMSDDIVKELKPLVKEIEERSRIEGIVFRVQYTSGDKVLYEKNIVNDEPKDNE